MKKKKTRREKYATHLEEIRNEQPVKKFRVSDDLLFTGWGVWILLAMLLFKSTIINLSTPLSIGLFIYLLLFVAFFLAGKRLMYGWSDITSGIIELCAFTLLFAATLVIVN